MKKALLIFSFVILLFSASVFAQTETDKNEKQVPIDTLLEADSQHNLNVAWQYFKLKKAYKAVLMRTEETIAANPTFSKIDEVLYLAGMSSYYLAEGKGKQKINLEVLSKEDQERFAPKRLREDAVALLSQLVESFPESKYADKAKETLKNLQPEK